MANALACQKCGNKIASDRLKLEFDGNCPWCLAAFALGDPPQDDPVIPHLVPAAGAFDSLGKYVLTEKLGTGGMGEVWKALDTELNRWVALKFLKDQEPRELARFKREAHMAAKLSHPNIAAVHEVGEVGGRHYIAMQCIEGRTLETFRTNDRRLLVRLCLDAARALDHAHRHGVIHRDVKPGNLMVEETEEGMKVVVLDFGLARSIEGGEKLSMSGSVVGTPQYVSPEQARAGKLDERTDVYSLGATMYELFTGRAPFEGKNVYEILKKIENEEPVAPRKIKPQISQDLQTIILKCLEKNRERRYAGAKELAYDLKRFLNHEAVLARPPSSIYYLRMKLSKRKAVVAAVAAVLVLVGGAAVVLPKMSSESRARDRLAEYQEAYDDGRNAWDEVQQMVSRLPWDRTVVKARQARGHFDRAIGILEQAGAQVLRGRCLQVERKPREAEAAWERALVLDPGNEEAHFHIAKKLLLDYLNVRGEGIMVDTGKSGADPPTVDVGAETKEETVLHRRAEKHLAAVGSGEKADYVRGVREVCLGRHKEGAALLAQYNREGWDSASFALEGLAHLFSANMDGAIGACTRAIELDPNDLRAFLIRGIARDAKGLHDEAILDFDKFISVEPKFSGAWSNRGAAKQGKGHFVEAIVDYDEAIRLDPTSSATLANRGKLKAEMGFPDEAIANFTEAIRLDSKRSMLFSNRASAFHDKELFDKSIEDFDEAIRLNPNNAKNYTNRGVAKGDKGLHDAAIVDHTLALEKNPKYAEARFNRGAMYFEKRLFDDAIADYDQAILLGLRTAVLYSNRGIARNSKGLHVEAMADYEEALSIDPKCSLAYHNRGAEKRRQGRLVEALADFELAVQHDPKAALARCMLGLTKSDMGLQDDAIADFDVAISLDRKYVLAHIYRGIANGKKGDLDLAIADLDRAIGLDPNNAMAYCNRGAAKQKKGLNKEALVDLDKAVDLDGKLAAAYSNRGLAKYSLGQVEEGIEDYTTAVGLDSKDAIAYFNRGVAKVSKGQYDDAIADYDAALRLNPDNSQGLCNRGIAKDAKGDLDGAIEDFTEALRLNPEFATAYGGRGNAQAAKGRHDEAIADYTEAIKREPENTTYFNNRGIMWSKKGLQEKAIEDYNEAIRLDRTNQKAHYNRAIEWESKGLLNEAIADYDQAIRLDPKYWDALCNRGALRWVKGLLDAAVADWEKSLACAPPEHPHRAVLLDLIATRGARLNIDEGNRLLGQKKFREAIAKYKALVTSFPKSLSANAAAYGVSCGYALLGEKNNALDWLEKSVEMGWTNLAHLEKDADLDSLRNEARYKKLTEKLRTNVADTD